MPYLRLSIAIDCPSRSITTDYAEGYCISATTLQATRTSGGATSVIQYGNDPNANPADYLAPRIPVDFDWTYSYDQADRLATVSLNGGITSTYSYDENGNRINANNQAGQPNQANQSNQPNQPGQTSPTSQIDPTSHQRQLSQAASHNTQDALTRCHNRTYTYNKDGDRLSKTCGGASANTANLPTLPTLPTPITTTYSYGSFGLLQSITLPAQAASTNPTNPTNPNNQATPPKTITYEYDGQKRRIAKYVNGQLTQGFLYQDQLRPIAEYRYYPTSTININQAATQTLYAQFIYASKINVPDIMLKGAGTNQEQTYKLVHDHLGSVRMVINTASGEVMQELDYDEWGETITDTNPGFQPFGYAGGLVDNDTKLIRFGARDYDPQAGAWTTKDPIGLAGGVNVYGYVGGDPIGAFDPTGLAPIRPANPRDAIEKAGECAVDALRSTGKSITDFVSSIYGKVMEGAQFGGQVSGAIVAGVGVSTSVGGARGRSGQVCAVTSVCGIAGPIIGSYATAEVTGGTGALIPGDESWTAGIVGSATPGAGAAGGASIASDGALSATVGVSLGAALGVGLQVCKQKISPTCSK